MHVCIYVTMCVWIHVYVCIIYWGDCPGRDVLPKMGGGIVRGVNCLGELSNGNCHMHSSIGLLYNSHACYSTLRTFNVYVDCRIDISSCACMNDTFDIYIHLYMCHLNFLFI